jgi:ubiquinone/menaquinone biosynthesis C-methylase UbiE
MTHSQNDRLITANIKAHDKVAGLYGASHGEIFNEVEQGRLRRALTTAVDAVRTEGRRALDFGTGSGNLTRHLVELGMTVTAADVSSNFLSLIKDLYPGPEVTAFKLNGKNLEGMADNSFDLIATYSVLHHVPDYLSAVAEFGRVCAPGGIVIIDHERPEYFWSSRPEYDQFVRAAKIFDVRKYLRWENYYGKIRRMLLDPKYAPEGDIHVWPDDHIEWSKIQTLLENVGFDVVLTEDYLLNDGSYRPEIYESHKERLCDMRMMIFRKR